MLSYLLKHKTCLLTARTKLSLLFRKKYTNTNVSFDVIDHNFPPPYMVNSRELIAHDKYLPNVYKRCYISGTIISWRRLYLLLQRGIVIFSSSLSSEFSLSSMNVLLCLLQISFCDIKSQTNWTKLKRY